MQMCAPSLVHSFGATLWLDILNLVEVWSPASVDSARRILGGGKSFRSSKNVFSKVCEILRFFTCKFLSKPSEVRLCSERRASHHSPRFTGDSLEIEVNGTCTCTCEQRSESALTLTSCVQKVVLGFRLEANRRHVSQTS